jgi:hypothetical protein
MFFSTEQPHFSGEESLQDVGDVSLSFIETVSPWRMAPNRNKKTRKPGTHMSEDRQTIKVGLGRKGQAPAAAEWQKTQKPEDAEVRGKDYGATRIVCPFCSAVCEMAEEVPLRRWFECWNCHQPFNY